ncbi:MAG TPA: hypothetical protein VM487_25405 [Phycisphaerae bacterium]|nr:hypothetical protein [Phycisphaerae bacterium]
MVWLLGIFGFLTLVGVVLTLKAVFPKRTGDTPYCRKCRYNLTGTDLQAEDARCPECGTYVTQPKAVLRGERRVWHRRLAVAVACLLLGAVPLGLSGYGAVKKVRWYSYYPTSWVFRDLASPNWKTAVGAFGELELRLKRGALSDTQRDRFVERCLAEQARPTLCLNIAWPAIRLLGKLYWADQFTEAERKTFLANCCFVSATARPTVIVGNPCPLRLYYKPRFPRGGLRGHLVLWASPGDSTKPRRVDGTEVIGDTSGMYGTLQLPDLPVGKHRPVLIAELEVYEGQENEPRATRIALTPKARKEFRLETEVMAQEPRDYITLKRSPGLDAAVRACIGPIEAYADDRARADRRLLYVIVPPVTVPPMGLAFDAFAEIDGQLLPLGPCTFSPREGRMGRSLVATLTGASPRSITVILKSSKDAAMWTVDLFEIWDGELRFEDVEVGTPPWR